MGLPTFDVPSSHLGLVFDSMESPYEIRSRPTPKPQPNEVLLKIEASGLNPVDWKAHRMECGPGLGFQYPAVPGMDGAGYVVAVGSAVDDAKVGDRVTFQGWYGEIGALQEYIVLPSHRVAKIPDSMTFPEAATISLCLATAVFGLYCPYDEDIGGAGLIPYWEENGQTAYKGKPILIIGGASSVGQFTIQVAKHQGFSPILTTASLKHTPYLHSLGADHVIDRYADLVDSINAYSPGLKFPVVYDAVNAPLPPNEADVLAPGGTLVAIFPIANKDELKLDEGKLAVRCLAREALFPELVKGMFKGLSGLIAEGVFKPSRVIKVENGFKGVDAALARLENNEISGHKLVLCPPETPRP